MKTSIGENIAYGIFLCALVLSNLYFMTFITTSGKSIKQTERDEAKSIGNYIEELGNIEKTNAKDMFEYFTDLETKTKEEILKDKDYHNTKLNDFNMLFPYSNNSYVVFEDGSYISSGNNSDLFFERHNLIDDEVYQKVINESSFVVLPLDYYNDELSYLYAYPLIDVNRQPFGLVVRTRNLEWFTQSLSEFDFNITQFVIMICDKNGNELALVSKDGVVYKEQNENFVSMCTKIDDEHGDSMYEYYDKDRQMIFKIYNTENAAYGLYQLITRIISMTALVIYTIIVLLYVIKKRNIRRDAIVIFTSLVLTAVINYCGFKYSYIQQEAETAIAQSEVARLLAEKETKMSDLIFDYIASIVYSNLDADYDKENYLNKIKNNVINSIDKNMVRYLKCDELYLHNEEYALNILTGDMISTTDYLKEQYEGAISNITNTYKGLYKYDIKNPLSKKIFNSYKINIDKNTSNALLLTKIRDSYELEDKTINRLFAIGNIREAYIGDIDGTVVTIGRLRENVYLPGNSLKNIEITKTSDPDVVKNFNEFKNINDNYLLTVGVNGEDKTRRLVVAKTYDTELLIMFFFDYEKLYVVRNEVVVNIVGIVICFAILVILFKMYLKYQNNKKEAIQLHGNIN